MLLSASRSFISKYLCRTFYNPRPRHTLTNHPMILNLIMHHTTPYYASPHVSHHFAIPISCYTTSHHILPTTPFPTTPLHTISHSPPSFHHTTPPCRYLDPYQGRGHGRKSKISQRLCAIRKVPPLCISVTVSPSGCLSVYLYDGVCLCLLVSNRSPFSSYSSHTTWSPSSSLHA